MVQIVWFKRDLRTVDHRPLHEAATRGPLIPLYIVEPGYWALQDTSRRHYIAIAAALQELGARLGELGAPLVIRVGEAIDVFHEIHHAHRVTHILAHEETGNDFTYARDRLVRRFARQAGIALQEFPQFGVTRRLTSRDDWGKGHADFMASPVLPEPKRLTPVADIASIELPSPEALGLAADGCDRPQPGTRGSAIRLIDTFFAGRGRAYRTAMSRPLDGAKSCSRLSVPLSTGAISIREVLQRCYAERADFSRRAERDRPIPLTAIDSLVARLHWHCHFIQKLETAPDIEWRAQHALHEAARRQTALEDPVLIAWATGTTGFPFVDACMRSLIATGWLNFRMRAMVQAFASYHLALDWHASGLQLARLFTDYEPGIHWPQVQMQSGQTGINTPRIYNPIKQGHDQDPTGQFVRRWVPELRGLPDVLIHEPWRLDAHALQAMGVVLGETYPARLVDHVVAARAARDRLTAVRHQAAYRSEALKVYDQLGSRTRHRSDVAKGRSRGKDVPQTGEQLQLFPDP
jgi:deoxyribodipyrimidine photo-lyase